MSPTVQNQKRIYVIQLAPESNGWPPLMRVEAETLTKKSMGQNDPNFELKKEGHVVCEITHAIAAWWIEESEGET